MPPLPTSLGVLPADWSRSRSTRSTHGMGRASGCVLGSRSKRASTSESRTSRSALTKVATSTERRSLSPNWTSSTTTVSFSFTTGTTPHRRRVCRVCRACRNRDRSARSGAVRSTCATDTPCRRKACSQARTRSGWPTAAAACLAGMVLGRSGNRRWAVPAATAPEETTTTSRPSARRQASSSASRSRTSCSRPSGPASTALPTLTTQRR